MATEFAHEPDASRYTLLVDGELATVLEYKKNGSNTIALVHTFTPPPFRGKGYAGQLVEYAVNDIEQNTTLRILAGCSYVHEWFEKHEDRKQLLER
ncbi:MAG TPA: GNAT family N-acetyltransferase [Glaciibacter sp.]|nr:GNAT family N-acetyltransferase [Glaciibacter sp.]